MAPTLKNEKLAALMKEISNAHKILAVDVHTVSPQTRNSWLGAQNMARQTVDRCRRDYLTIASDVTGYVLLKGSLEHQRVWAAQAMIEGALVVDIMGKLIAPMASQMRRDIVGHMVNTDDLIAMHYLLDMERVDADLKSGYFEPNQQGLLQRSIRSIDELQVAFRDYATRTMPTQWWTGWVEKKALDNACDENITRHTILVVVVGLDDNLLDNFGVKTKVVATTESDVSAVLKNLQSVLTPASVGATMSSVSVVQTPEGSESEVIPTDVLQSNKPRGRKAKTQE